MTKLPLSALLIIISIFLTGCINPGVVQLTPDTYVISRTDKGGIFGNASAMKADVITEANEFAASKGMVAVPVSVKESPLQVMRSFASITYEFKLVDKSGSDPALSAIIEKCKSDFDNNLGLDPIRAYIPQFASEVTLSQRANNKKPTLAEKGSLEVLDQVQSNCRQNALDYYTKKGAPPDVRLLLSKSASEQKDLLMDLWSGKLTYGQYNQKRVAISDKYKAAEAQVLNVERNRADARAESQAKISVAEQEARARVDAAQQAADAQSSIAATQRMMLLNQQQPKTIVVQPSQPNNPAGTPGNPIQTNCSKLGDSVNCRTYSY